MNKIILLMGIFFILIIPFSIFPHGVDIVTISGGTGIHAKYDTGDPISHAEVTVYSPGNSSEPFQSGVTDRNGRFLFSPDQAGEWRVVVNDWTGHGGTIHVRVGPDTKTVAENKNKQPGRGIKILSGISVIFGMTGMIFFFLTRRERKRDKDAHS